MKRDMMGWVYDDCMGCVESLSINRRRQNVQKTFLGCFTHWDIETKENGW